MSVILSSAVPAADANRARDHGLALAALCVGAMVLARTFEDPALSNRIREVAQATAVHLLGGNSGDS